MKIQELPELNQAFLFFDYLKSTFQSCFLFSFSFSFLLCPTKALQCNACWQQQCCSRARSCGKAWVESCGDIEEYGQQNLPKEWQLEDWRATNAREVRTPSSFMYCISNKCLTLFYYLVLFIIDNNHQRERDRQTDRRGNFFPLIFPFYISK